VPDSCTKVGVLGVGHCNGIIQTEPQLTTVATVTKIIAHCHKSLASVNQRRATITLGFATPSSFQTKMVH